MHEGLFVKSLAGETVVMNAGPLAGLNATLIEALANGRVVLSVELPGEACGRTIRVEIDGDWVTRRKAVQVTMRAKSANGLRSIG